MGTADRGRAGDEENKNLDIEGKSRVRLIGKDLPAWKHYKEDLSP